MHRSFLFRQLNEQLLKSPFIRAIKLLRCSLSWQFSVTYSAMPVGTRARSRSSAVYAAALAGVAVGVCRLA